MSDLHESDNNLEKGPNGCQLASVMPGSRVPSERAKGVSVVIATTLIAGAALVFSGLSLWVSYLAYRHSVRFQEQEAYLEFSREKSEFLERIQKAIQTFERVEDRLQYQLSRIDSAAEPERSSITIERTRISADLDHLEKCLRQARSLWDETYEMSRTGLAHHGPIFQSLIENDEEFAQDAMSRCDTRETMLRE